MERMMNASCKCFGKDDETWVERTRGWVRALYCFAARAHLQEIP